ncbi:MAG TPA: GGDEF domain-containing protein [Fontimonas sp.]
MKTLFDALLGSGLPHGYCLAWKPGLLWTMVITDLLIGLAYVSISSAPFVFIRRRRELQFSWMFVLFGIFIFACGLTHFVAVVGIWKPVYQLEAAVKVVTALASLGTAIVLWPLIGTVARFLDEREALARSNDALRSELLENSLRDPLTSLYNRRFLNETLSLEGRRGYAIVMLDIDHFKKINDQHGHPTGDIVLQAIAKMLLSTTRKGDVICRYGGEEFTIVMRGATMREGMEQAERVRRACADLTLSSYGGVALGRITLSAGVAAYPGNGEAPTAVLEAADRALYKAKRDGRDRAQTAAE